MGIQYQKDENGQINRFKARLVAQGYFSVARYISESPDAFNKCVRTSE